MSYGDIVVGSTGTGISRVGFGLPVKAAIDDLDERVGAVEGMVFGTQSVSFTSLTSHTIVIPFGVTFLVPPQVFTNISSTAGATSKWFSRAYNETTTGFTLYLAVADAASPASSWSNIPVNWRAFPV